jgi:hypothetical protein
VDRRSVAAWGGIAGPAAFITAWAVLGAATDGYDPVHDPISRLAATDADTRTAMTAGFLVFSSGVAAYAGPLRRTFGGPTAAAALTTAAATAAVAALPLEGPGGGVPHAAAAGLAYAALAAVPLLGGLALRTRDDRSSTSRWAAWSFAAAAVTGTSLAASAFAPTHHGLLQRIGLTVGDAWLIASALGVLGASRGPRTPAAAGASAPGATPSGRRRASWRRRSTASARSTRPS